MRSPRYDVGVRAWLLAATLVGCVPTYAEPRVSVRMSGTPPDALVTVDDQVVGPLAVVAKKGLSVSRGKHRVSVERPGYCPWDRKIDAEDGKIVLDVKLERIPD